MSIVFFGDSITEQFETLKNHKDVWNLGRSGDKTIDLIGRFVTVTRIQPETMFVMIGTNDYLVEQKVWQDYIQIDYGVMMDALFTLFHDNLPKTKIYVISIPPVRWPKLDIFTSNNDIDKRNTLLQTKVRQNGFTYLDLASLLKDDDNAMKETYTTDGVHFSEAGYEVFYNLVKPYME